MQRRGLLACLVLCLGGPNLPSSQQTAFEPAPPATTLEAAPGRDPVVEHLRGQFERHHTGLSSFEIEQVAHTIAYESERLGPRAPSLASGISPSPVRRSARVRSRFRESGAIRVHR
jgi:hypothetical protein